MSRLCYVFELFDQHSLNQSFEQECQLGKKIKASIDYDN